MAKTAVFEHDPAVDGPLGPDEVDGMQDFMAELDAPTSTDWDASVEPPPHNLEPEIKALWDKPA